MVEWFYTRTHARTDARTHTNARASTHTHTRTHTESSYTHTRTHTEISYTIHTQYITILDVYKGIAQTVNYLVRSHVTFYNWCFPSIQTTYRIVRIHDVLFFLPRKVVTSFRNRLSLLAICMLQGQAGRLSVDNGSSSSLSCHSSQVSWCQNSIYWMEWCYYDLHTWENCFVFNSGN